MEKYRATFVTDGYWYFKGKLIGTEAHWGNTLDQLGNQFKLASSPTISSKTIDGKKEYTIRKSFMGFGGKSNYGTLALIESREVNGEKTIIYSNGIFTNGEKIITNDVSEWLDHFEKTINEPARICLAVYAEDGSVTKHSIPVSIKK